MKFLLRQLSYLAPALVLSGWGAVLLQTFLQGHLNRLLSPIFRPSVAVGGIVLILLSGAYLVFFASPAAIARRSWPEQARDALRWLLLLVPLLLAAAVLPPNLSGATIANRTPTGTAGALPMPALSDSSAENVQQALRIDRGEPAPLEVTDMILISQSSTQIAAFLEKKVQVVGLFVPGSPPKLMRWLVWCCAADARPVSIILTGPLPPGLSENDWLEVTGSAQFPSTLGQVVPQVQVISIKHVPEPDEPYLSP